MTGCEWVNCDAEATHVFDRGFYGLMPLCAAHTELARGFTFGTIGTLTEIAEAGTSVSVQVTVRATVDPNDYLDLGQRAGLRGGPLAGFWHRCNVHDMTYEVDRETGDATLIMVDGRSLGEKPS